MDSQGCVEHVWVLAELVFDANGTLQVWRCTRCGSESAHAPEGGPRNLPVR